MKYQSYSLVDQTSPNKGLITNNNGAVKTVMEMINEEDF